MKHTVKDLQDCNGSPFYFSEKNLYKVTLGLPFCNKLNSFKLIRILEVWKVTKLNISLSASTPPYPNPRDLPKSPVTLPGDLWSGAPAAAAAVAAASSVPRDCRAASWPFRKVASAPTAPSSGRRGRSPAGGAEGGALSEWKG